MFPFARDAITFALSASMILLLTACQTAQLQDTHSPGMFTLEIEQDGKPVHADERTFTLAPRPFSIVVTFFEKPYTLYVNADLNNTLYRVAETGVSMEGVLGFDGRGMAEVYSNEGKELWLTCEGWGVWFYDTKSEHRFNDVRMTEEGVVCRRDIAKLWHMDDGKRYLTPADVAGTNIFLVFSLVDYNEQTYEYRELERWPLILSFTLSETNVSLAASNE